MFIRGGGGVLARDYGSYLIINCVCTVVHLICLIDSQMQNRKGKPFHFPWVKRRRGQDAKRKKYRVFGAPLDAIIINNQLPEILQVSCEFVFWFSRDL